MLKSKNIFVCIGAIHYDYLLNLKKNIINYRTNPIIHNSKIGGVAYNVAEIISIFENVLFFYIEHVKNKNLLKDLDINFWSTIAVYKNNKQIARGVGLVEKDQIYLLIEKGI